MSSFPALVPPLAVDSSLLTSNAVTTSKIAADAVTNAKLANMAANTIKGSVAGGDPADLTAAQARSIINVTCLSKVANGVAAAGPVTLTGAVVGMNVVQVLTVTAGALVDSTALFESTITVTNQIQQTSASDLSLVVYSFLLQR